MAPLARLKRLRRVRSASCFPAGWSGCRSCFKSFSS